MVPLLFAVGLMGVVAEAGITRPAFDRRSLSSGTLTRIRSAVSRISSLVSGVVNVPMNQEW